MTHSDSPDHGSPWHTAWLYLACYGLWLVYSGLAFWLIFLVRDLFVTLSMVAHLNPWAVRAVDKWTVYVLGAAWLAAVIWMEGALRQSVERRTLWQLAGRLAAALIAIGGVSYGIQQLLQGL
ncbi:hypothetical protein FKZ61_022940 [Litorilinea aerophila]|uniref:Uncharacterized protein n=1 Tax=Litorilinea aerophila TaxID=1204385 RepID=A0A540V8V6_9CHLR|nr:hypothetical protein [Litorilinea aerophila]MCC9078955.1 hypothetical protein [Litorilinea aerophila]OUC07127.1 hypothetical protein RY27_16760 [Litorilinea aerophila]